MKNTIKQEIYKMIKQQLILKQTSGLASLILIIALVTKFTDFMSAEKVIPVLFNSGWLIVFCMVYLASQIFSMEFRYGTIKNLLQKNPQRRTIFLGKVFTLVGYSIYLNLIALVTTIAASLILFPQTAFDDAVIFETLLTNLLASFIGMWLFASLSLMISLIVKNESLASMLGIGSYFMSSMLAGLQFMALDKLPWLRWNPFNMLNLANQLANSSLSKMTLLSTQQLVIGNILYILLFIFIAKMVFYRKKV